MDGTGTDTQVGTFQPSPMGTRMIRIGVAAAVVSAVLVGAGYLVAQRALRQAADHPQVEMARDAASRLDAGASSNSVLPTEAVDMSSSAAAYLIVVDRQGEVLASSATLNGEQVVPPTGVFSYVSAHGEDRISWQPAPGVRSAIVVDGFKGGFVVAGRSLGGTEDLESSLLVLAAAAWGGLMAAAVGIAALLSRRRRIS